MRRTLVTRPAIGTALVLVIPLVMTVLDRDKPAGEGWHWKPGSFLVMGALVFGAGVLHEYLASRTQRPAAKAAIGGTILLGVLAIWSELAVDAVSRIFRTLGGG